MKLVPAGCPKCGRSLRFDAKCPACGVVPFLPCSVLIQNSHRAKAQVCTRPATRRLGGVRLLCAKHATIHREKAAFRAEQEANQ